jgi:hypothetical protein
MSTSFQFGVGVPPTIFVDFNDLEDRVYVSALRGQIALAPGVLVLLTDSEDNTCYGHVQRLDGPLVRIRIDRETWVPGDIQPQGARPGIGFVAPSVFSEQRQFTTV